MKGLVIFLSLLIFLTDCKKKRFSEDIKECDTMGNYYEDGEHYISREFINDESGSLNYEKLFEKMDRRNSKCNPENTFNP